MFISLAGVEERSQAVVFVTSDVAVQGYLYRGSSTAADPTGVTGAFEIRNFKKTPTFDGRDAERKVLL